MENKNINKVISVIVPANNAADTIARCLDSLSKQTYKNLEIIVVVNACSDNTEEIVRRYSCCDPRIVVISTETPGVSHARNLGLEYANGEFIGFMDADDWSEANFFEDMIRAAFKEEADIVCSGRIIDSANSHMLEPVCDSTLILCADDFYFGILTGPFYGFVWNKLFSRRAILDKRFNESMEIIEDVAFCCSIVKDNYRYVAIPGCYYHYVDCKTSATHDISRLVSKDGKWAYLEGGYIIQSTASTPNQKEMCTKANILFAASGVLELAGRTEYKNLYIELRNYLKSNLASYLSINQSYSIKIKTLLAFFLPHFWRLLRKSSRLMNRN
jgi:glycosyltransferase involved in cell wall biosynthesis